MFTTIKSKKIITDVVVNNNALTITMNSILSNDDK